MLPRFPMRRYFGERGELFQYKFIGRHRVESGFTSLVLAHELQARAAYVLREGPRMGRAHDVPLQAMHCQCRCRLVQ